MVDDKWVNKILEVFSLLGMLQKIIFVGDGPQLPKYKTLYPNACFLWRVMPEKVLELLAQSKYYISASLMEGMPYGLIEAMSLGIVPVVSDVEWHKDLIIQGYNWFLFRDNADLLNSIFKINLISEDYYKNISQSAIVSMSQLRQSGEASLLNIFSKN